MLLSLRTAAASCFGSSHLLRLGLTGWGRSAHVGSPFRPHRLFAPGPWLVVIVLYRIHCGYGPVFSGAVHSWSSLQLTSMNCVHESLSLVRFELLSGILFYSLQSHSSNDHLTYYITAITTRGNVIQDSNPPPSLGIHAHRVSAQTAYARTSHDDI